MVYIFDVIDDNYWKSFKLLTYPIFLMLVSLKLI